MEAKDAARRCRELNLRYAFFGTGDFARRLLVALWKAGCPPQLLVTSPPRPAGRGRKLQDPPIKAVAESAGIPVLQPEKPHTPQVLQYLSELDFLVVCDYGKILKKPVLEAPRIAPLNAHPSLLPRWRGAAPVERALMAGDPETGVTIFVMDEGIDTGPILLQERVPIHIEETREELENRLIEKAVPLLIEAMAGLRTGTLRPRPQPEEEATYAYKLRKEELWVQWTQPAEGVVRHIHALSPRPGARTYFDSQYVKLLRARRAPPQEVRGLSEAPGTIRVVNGRLWVAAGEGWVEILELQPEGKRPMRAAAYLQGNRPHRAHGPD